MSLHTTILLWYAMKQAFGVYSQRAHFQRLEPRQSSYRFIKTQTEILFPTLLMICHNSVDNGPIQMAMDMERIWMHLVLICVQLSKGTVHTVTMDVET